jgi:hypothetical protein
MAINILSKADKKLSQLKDGIRVLAWEQYKIDNRVKGEEGYKFFEQEWLTHEIHKMDQAKFDKFIAGLGYTVDDLLAERNRYYQKRNRATGIGNEPASFDSFDNEPASVDYVEGNQPDNIPY